MAKSYQILLPDAEKQRLISRIEDDFSAGKASHQRWSENCRRWLQRWEARVAAPKKGDEDKPNHTVPLIQWQCFNKLARDMQAMLGDEARITAAATGPSDVAKVHKVGCYMTSRVFDQMQITNPLIVFEFRRILFGHAVAYRPWYRREFTTLENGRPKRVCDYEGPGFFPCEPDDLVVPPERGVTSIQDFSWVIRRCRVTVDDLQRGDGTLYQGTSNPEFVKRALDWAKQGPTNDYQMVGNDPVRTEREEREGVDYDSHMLGRRTLWMWEWYGSWRPLKKRKSDAAEDDLTKREQFEADWVVRFIPGMREIVGVQDLLELYPKMRRRRPFVESTLIKDGTYRPKGFGALLEDIEDEATSTSRLFTAAGELSVWPIVIYKPGGGMQPKAMKIEPGMAIPSEEPGGTNVIQIRPNLEYAIAKLQDTYANGERVSGQSDLSSGRAIERPNAPKTATGTLALIEEGNIRAWLDSTILKEDMEQIVSDFWELDCDLAPKTQPGLFFRVTEQDAKGLFDTAQGGAYMTATEFGGRYDFTLKFATSIYARERKKAEIMAFYQIASQNPLIAMNPKALWNLTNRVAQEFGITDFADIVPQPPEMDAPMNPDQEWTKMLEGEEVQPHPEDHDQLHLMAHTKALETERMNPDRDVQAIGLMVKHVLAHQQQMRTKALMQALTSKLMNDLAAGAQQPAPASPPLQLPDASMYSAPEQAPAFSPSPGNGDIPGRPAGASMAPQPHEGMM